jgi:hypothetical protein
MFVDRRNYPETLCPIIAEPHVAYRLECNSPGWHNHFIRAIVWMGSGLCHGSGFPPSEAFLSREFLNFVAFQQDRLVWLICQHTAFATDAAFATDHMLTFRS